MIQPDEYKFFEEFLEKENGLVLGQGKEYLLESRLEPICEELKIGSFSELVLKLKTTEDQGLFKKINEAMTTNESLFFRDETPFQILRDTILPSFEKQTKLRIWSAACSTGQEPYSIAMSLLDYSLHFKDPKLWSNGWPNFCDVEILATDYNQAVLERARSGVFTEFETQRGLNEMWLNKFFVRHPQGWQVSEELRRMVTFSQLNLLGPLTGLGEFDVIFCRYLLIYFSQQTKKEVLERISYLLKPKGFLFLGGTESILGLSDKFELLEGAKTAVYRKVNGVGNTYGVSRDE